jgi:hypothetical protein
MNALVVRRSSNLHLQRTRRRESGWQDKNQCPINTIPSPKPEKKLDIQGPPEKGTPNSTVPKIAETGQPI